MSFLEFIIIWIVGMIVGTGLYCAWKNEFERNLIRKMEMRDATKEEQKAVIDYVRSISHRILDVPIPDNPTNGDVIKAVFSDAEIHIDGNDVLIHHMGFWIKCNIRWWNAPYKKR